MEQKPSLFLDRDGVINRRTPGDYIRHPEDFIPAKGALQAIAQLTPHFGRIVVVTNQAGIGKGLMDERDLDAVHRKMLALVNAAGGRLDAIYFCPHRPDAACACRKPAAGMALQAQRDFPEIQFNNSWIVGDSASDMRLGHSLGMRTVLVDGKFEEAAELAAMAVDHRLESLLAFAAYLEKAGASAL